MTTQLHTAGPDEENRTSNRKNVRLQYKKSSNSRKWLFKGNVDNIGDLSVSPLCPTETVGYVVEEICGCHSRNRNAE